MTSESHLYKASDHSDVDLVLTQYDQAICERKYQELADELSRVHATFLFYENKPPDHLTETCNDVFCTLIKRIYAVNDDRSFPEWMTLGVHLQMNMEDLRYIESNEKLECSTEAMLFKYSLQSSATLGNIIIGLINMKRFDVIQGIYEPLVDLWSTISLQQIGNTDSGYTSFCCDGIDILRPQPGNIRRMHLPKVLIDKFEHSNSFDISSYLKPTMPEIRKHSVLLTYYADGIELAERIVQACVEYGISAVRLNEMRNTAQMNPERYLKHYYTNVDFVVPIITDGYVDALKSTEPPPIDVDNFDCQHVQFLYEMLSNDWKSSMACLNLKVRCICADNITTNARRELGKYPLLNIWGREAKLSEFLAGLFPGRRI